MAAPDLIKSAPEARADATEADAEDLAGLEAGLDALEAYDKEHTSFGRVLVQKVLPPVVAILLVLLAWQVAYWMELKPRYALPSPGEVWDAFMVQWRKGTVIDILWTSLSRGILGFAIAVAIGTPLGLLVARVGWVRAAIGPILSGLQSLPSVAWVPPAVIWFGLNNSAIYAVVLLGAVPSIANGLVSGIDQIPPLYLRAGRVLGARGLNSVWHVMLPASLPGYIAGLKQGWAFSWRSLMAAELIAAGPELGVGLGQLMDQGRDLGDMPMMLTAVVLILIVGIGIDMLVFSPIERMVLRRRGLTGSR
ncbi:ABC transporter permease [Embleya sp. NPDC020630]|uniref:ABC transporter permease n=1 Tax=Embleya sp. NPDC020630 TaxID=3363979 RepID=UPI0037A804E0